MHGGKCSVAKGETHAACHESLLESGDAMMFLDADHVLESRVDSVWSGLRVSSPNGCSTQVYSESRLSPENPFVNSSK